MIEAIICNECDALFAACSVSSIDEAWVKSKKKYLRENCRAEVVDKATVRAHFATCKCGQKDVEKPKQLQIFENPAK